MLIQLGIIKNIQTAFQKAREFEVIQHSMKVNLRVVQENAIKSILVNIGPVAILQEVTLPVI